MTNYVVHFDRREKARTRELKSRKKRLPSGTALPATAHYERLPDGTKTLVIK